MIWIDYETRDGVILERMFKNFAAVKKFVMVKTDEGRRRRAYRRWPSAQKAGDIYPRYSNAIRFLPNRRGEFCKLMEDNGVRGCDLDKKGRARVNSVSHQNQMMEVLGLCNHDAGYSDRAPTQY